MPTVAEVLKSAGLSDEQITAIDKKATDAFSQVLTLAEQREQAAELAQRSAAKLLDEEITPALNAWGVKETNLTAERDYYKTLAEKSKAGGFIADVPPFKPGDGGAKGPDGRFVANANAVPGSPNFQEFESKVAGAMGTLADVQWKYRTLYGAEMPDSPTTLGAEAGAQKLSMAEYAARKYDFAGKQKAIEAEKAKAHEDKIRADAAAERDKFWAEKGGNNPSVRQGEISNFTELRKGVAEGSRRDPLKMSRDERRAATTNAIRAEVAATN